MLACKCDICGKLFLPNEDGTVSKLCFIEQVPLDEKEVVVPTHYQNDLCPECAESFTQWEHDRESKSD